MNPEIRFLMTARQLGTLFTTNIKLALQYTWQAKYNNDGRFTCNKCSALVQYIQVLCMNITKTKHNNVIYYCICLSNAIKDWKVIVRKAFLKLRKYSTLTICSGRPFQVETTLLKKQFCAILSLQRVVFSLNEWPLVRTADYEAWIAKEKCCFISAVIRPRILLWTIAKSRYILRNSRLSNLRYVSRCR